MIEKSFYVELLDKFLTYDFPGKRELEIQAQKVKMRLVSATAEGMIVEFYAHLGPPASVDNRLPIELEARDEDGVLVAALLFVDDGKLSLMDIYKVDGSRIVSLPKASSFSRASWEKVDDNTRVRM